MNIKYNAVHGNRGDGLFIDDESTVVVEDNSITCNNGNGILTSNNSKVCSFIDD